MKATKNRVRFWTSRARERLRRVMPYVAGAAALLQIVGQLFRHTALYGEHFVGALLESVTTLLVVLAISYYLLKLLRYTKRRLLWRVRHRLAVTYVFVGITPILLLLTLGLIFGLLALANTTTRLVASHFAATERQSLLHARAIAERLARLPATADDASVRRVVNEQVSLLQPVLPGARLAVWRSAKSEDAAATLGFNQSAAFVAEPTDEQARGAGIETMPFGAALPEWLRERDEWSGFAFLPAPANAEISYSAPSVRALVRRRRHQNHSSGSGSGAPASPESSESSEPSVTVLLVVPVNRLLIQQLRESTELRLQPILLTHEKDDVQINLEPGASTIKIGEPGMEQVYSADKATDSGKESANSNKQLLDQFGDPISIGWIPPAPVVMSTVSWQTGAEGQRPAFIANVSMSEIGSQVFGKGNFGQATYQALAAFALFLLFLQFLAVISAAWMTRAVTGTVHQLYRATEFIKQGNFSHRVKTRSHDQLGELAGAFNNMSGNIESLLQERVEHEKLERELEIAAEVQAKLFPTEVPRLETAEIAGECRAARGVAGDYYDYLEVAPGKTAIALGDVSGKGIAASLVMSNLQAALRAQATVMAERMKIVKRADALMMSTAAAVSRSGIAASSDINNNNNNSSAAYNSRLLEDAETHGTVADMVASINEQLCRCTDANRFATLFLALYDDQTRSFRYTSAGHNPTLLVRADGTTQRLSTGGMMVGAFEWAEYEEASIEFNHGDLLVIFSDGISEATNAIGEEYSEDRLAALAVQHRYLAADDVRRIIFDEVDRWSGDAERGDDQTLVIVKGVISNK